MSRSFFLDSDSTSVGSVGSVTTEDLWSQFASYEMFPRMEGSTLEFKQSIADLHQKKIPETLCGFLNTQGGSMVFGVRDDGLITGLSSSRKMIDDFLLHIDRIFHEAVIRSTDSYERVHPSCVRTEVLTCYNGKPVVVVTVTPVLDTQYQTRDGAIWYRLNASNYKISGSEQLYTEMDIRAKLLQTRKVMTKEFEKVLQGLRQQLKTGDGDIRSLKKTFQMQISAGKEETAHLTDLLHAKILQEKAQVEKELGENSRSWLCSLW